MSFSLVRTNKNLIDIRANYKQLSDEFCRHYYTLYDTNFSQLENLYCHDAQFTYQDEEILGFKNFVDKLKNKGYYNFAHINMNINNQPIGPNNLLITVMGTISINNSIYLNKFTETLLVQRDDLNKFYICSTFFKFID